MDGHGPPLTPAKAAVLHDRPEPVAWFALATPSGDGVIARAHTEAHDGGELLPGHLAAADIDGLTAMMPRWLRFYPAPPDGPIPGCLGTWFGPITGRPAGDGHGHR